MEQRSRAAAAGRAASSSAAAVATRPKRATSSAALLAALSSAAVALALLLAASARGGSGGAPPGAPAEGRARALRAPSTTARPGAEAGEDPGAQRRLLLPFFGDPRSVEHKGLDPNESKCCHVVKLTATATGDGAWQFAATMSSPYEATTGWGKYCQAFEIRDADSGEGTVLAWRSLRPHPKEQPFTEPTMPAVIPPGVRAVVAIARDKVDGYCGHAVRMEMDAPSPIVSTSTSTANDWPLATADDTSTIPVGNYVLHDNSGNNNASPHGLGRVLLYVTSHMSIGHEMFLKHCWSNILARSNLLQEAHVAVYLNPNDESKRNAAMELLSTTFQNNPSLTVYLRSPLLYHQGANTAMYEAVTSNFFSGYDWIIRLNPDVIVLDDSNLIANMANPKMSALLINCNKRKNRRNRGMKVHTDFFAIRPSVFNPDTYPKKTRMAEEGMTVAILPLLENHKDEYIWMEDAAPVTPTCRAGYGRGVGESPIVHEHAMNFTGMCNVVPS